MTIGLDQAIKTAMEFERKVYAVYADAMGKITDPVGRRIFKQLSIEEAEHVSYLKHRMDELLEKGHINIQELSTVVPDKKRIAEESERITQSLQSREPASTEIEYLKHAFEVEKETSEFYRQMASELSGEGQELFSHFLAIEEGHIAIVQAEIDSVQGMGFWFDMQEFSLEGG